MFAPPFVQAFSWLYAVSFSVSMPFDVGLREGLVLHPVEAGLVAQTNAERARYALHPLTVDPALVRSARAHAGWMTRNRSLQHTMAAVAENIAMGQQTPGEAVRDWMSSPGHRANILNPSYTRLGVAAYTTPEGTVYWCQQFLP